MAHMRIPQVNTAPNGLASGFGMNTWGSGGLRKYGVTIWVIGVIHLLAKSS